MTDEKKPPIFSEDDHKRLNEDSGDHDRHFLPRPEEQEDKSTNNKE